MKVIPKVGQVWIRDETGEQCEISVVDNLNNILWTTMQYTAIEDLHRLYTFKPVNDLEWLAVNVSEWEKTGTYPYLRKFNGHEYYHRENTKTESSYTRRQWQDKRNELFGVEKMKKVEYVKVECPFWMAAKEHEEFKCFFYLFDGEYHPVNSLTVLASQFTNGNIYRRTERDATWQEEVCEYINNLPEIDKKVINHNNESEGRKAGFCFDSCRLSDNEIIALSHLVASMTTNPKTT